MTKVTESIIKSKSVLAKGKKLIDESRRPLSPRVLDHSNGTPAGVFALMVALERSKGLVKPNNLKS